MDTLVVGVCMPYENRVLVIPTNDRLANLFPLVNHESTDTVINYMMGDKPKVADSRLQGEEKYPVYNREHINENVKDETKVAPRIEVNSSNVVKKGTCLFNEKTIILSHFLKNDQNSEPPFSNLNAFSSSKDTVFEPDYFVKLPQMLQECFGYTYKRICANVVYVLQGKKILILIVGIVPSVSTYSPEEMSVMSRETFNSTYNVKLTSSDVDAYVAGTTPGALTAMLKSSTGLSIKNVEVFSSNDVRHRLSHIDNVIFDTLVKRYTLINNGNIAAAMESDRLLTSYKLLSTSGDLEVQTTTSVVHVSKEVSKKEDAPKEGKGKIKSISKGLTRKPRHDDQDDNDDDDDSKTDSKDNVNESEVHTKKGKVNHVSSVQGKIDNNNIPSVEEGGDNKKKKKRNRKNVNKTHKTQIEGHVDLNNALSKRKV